MIHDYRLNRLPRFSGFGAEDRIGGLSRDDRAGDGGVEQVFTQF
jgi:hypothetical protein